MQWQPSIAGDSHNFGAQHISAQELLWIPLWISNCKNFSLSACMIFILNSAPFPSQVPAAAQGVQPHIEGACN